MKSGHPDPNKIQQFKDQVAAIDARLTPLEDEFLRDTRSGSTLDQQCAGKL